MAGHRESLLNREKETKMIRGLIKLSVIAMLGTVGLAGHAYPDKPIKIVVPFGSGTSVDALARQFGNALSGVVKQTVVIDNKPGAGGCHRNPSGRLGSSGWLYGPRNVKLDGGVGCADDQSGSLRPR